MKRKELFDGLTKSYGETKPKRLAEKTGISVASLCGWQKSDQPIKPFQVGNLLKKAQEQAIKHYSQGLVRPIVEYFPIDLSESRSGEYWEIFKANKKDFTHLGQLRKELEDNKGVYVFYDSRGRILYVGKTEKQSLWREIKTRLNAKSELRKVNVVSHPTSNVQFVPAHKKLRPIVPKTVLLADMAHYLSVYAIDTRFIGAIEALLLRVTANDNLNKKMESFPHLKEVG